MSTTTQKSIAVKVKKEYANLAEFLPLGFETSITPVLSTSKKKLVNETSNLNQEIGKREITNEAVYAPIGTFEGYTFKAANGMIYGESFIRNAIGFVSLDKIFTLLN